MIAAAAAEDEVISDSEAGDELMRPEDAIESQGEAAGGVDLSTKLIYNIEHLLSGLHTRREADRLKRKALEKEVQELKVALSVSEHDQ